MPSDFSIMWIVNKGTKELGVPRAWLESWLDDVLAHQGDIDVFLLECGPFEVQELLDAAKDAEVIVKRDVQSRDTNTDLER